MTCEHEYTQLEEIAHGEIVEMTKCIWCGIELKLNSKKKAKVWTADKFLKADIPKPKWQVEGMIPEKSFTIIGGYQSSLKSHISVSIALAVSHGTKLFGKFECKKGNVLYINEEMNAGSFQEMLKKIGEGMRIKVDNKLLITNFVNKKLDVTEDNKWFLNTIKKNNIKLVILDTARECYVAKENEADRINELLHNYMRPIIEETDCSFLFLMHRAKVSVGSDNRQEVDMLRGSSQFRNYADSIILVERYKKSGRVDISQKKIRGIKEADDFTVSWDWQDDKITTVVMSEDEIKRNLIDDCKAEIMEYVKKHNINDFETGDKPDSLSKRFIKPNKYSRGTFYSSIKELKVEGKIHQKKRGKYEVGLKGVDNFVDKI